MLWMKNTLLKLLVSSLFFAAKLAYSYEYFGSYANAKTKVNIFKLELYKTSGDAAKDTSVGLYFLTPKAVEKYGIILIFNSIPDPSQPVWIADFGEKVGENLRYIPFQQDSSQPNCLASNGMMNALKLCRFVLKGKEKHVLKLYNMDKRFTKIPLLRINP
jgi:hypothetical protein